MGGYFSTDDSEPKELVLVPPLFERDFKGRSRMAKSSYDFVFHLPRKWLFTDYMRAPEATSILRFRPSEDPRISTTTRLGTSMDKFGDNNFGKMALRFQPSPDEPMSFVDIKAAAHGAGGATARACWFDAERNLGIFGMLPLVAQPSGASDARVGLRYSSPNLSVGLISKPLSESVSQIWAVGRNGPFAYGVQLTPEARVGMPADGQAVDFPELLKAAHRCASYALSYSPMGSSSGKGNFTAALELQNQRQLSVSLLHHMAVQRLCKNPLEEGNVVGITNYLDIGLQVITNLVDSPTQDSVALDASHLQVAAAWQVNKNWLVKAKLGSDTAACALALKAWWQPSMTFALSAAYDFTRRMPRLGFTFCMENYGRIRYERTSERYRMGKALVQRHVALPEDIANKEGKGLLVHKKDLDNKAILGQVEPASASYL